MNFKHPIILGSSSPRRKFLLQEAGFTFTVVSPEIDESYPDSLPPNEVPAFLAQKKADAFQKISNDAIVITADTIVILNSRILNKPNDRTEAISMLMDLSGKTHTVITSVCLSYHKKRNCFDDFSYVTFRNIGRSEIENYVDSYKPFDKAGAYGAQECLPSGYNPCSIDEIEFLQRIDNLNLIENSIVRKGISGVSIIEKIEGSYFNVMGLPIHLVHQHIQNFG